MALMMLNFQDEARAEAKRLEYARALLRCGGSPPALHTTLVARARKHATRRQLGGRILLIFRASVVDGAERTLEHRVSAAVVTVAANDRRSASIRAAIRTLEAVARPVMADGAEAWNHQVATDATCGAATRERREHAIVELWARRAPRVIQRGLFDRRADRALGVDAAAEADRLRNLRRRIAAAAELAPARGQVELVLVLVP